MQKPIIIFLCGYAMTEQAYRPFIDHLHQKYDVRVVTFVGVQSSEVVEDYIQKVIDETKDLESFSVMGHSFGGAMATIFSHRFPDKVNELFLLNPVGIPPKSYLQFFRPGQSPESLTEFFTTPEGRKIIEVFADSLVRNPRQMVEWILLIRQIDLRSIYPEIQVRTHVWWSDQDRIFSVEDGQEISKLIPDSDFHLVSGNHAWMILHPDLFIIK